MKQLIIISGRFCGIEYKFAVRLCFQLIIPPNFVRIGVGFIWPFAAYIGWTILQINSTSVGLITATYGGGKISVYKSYLETIIFKSLQPVFSTLSIPIRNDILF